SQTVLSGGSATYTAGVSAQNGFNSSVSLATSGLPTGASGIFNPGSVTGSGSSTLTVSTSCGLAAGSYPFTITGTSGILSHSAGATLVVNASPADYTIAVAPPSNTVTVGSGTTYTVSVSAIGCFTGTVALAASGLPAGATATFSQTSITGSGSSTLTIS